MDEKDGYLLDIYAWDLSEKDEMMFTCALWILDNKCSIRSMTKECLVARSTFYDWYKYKLKKISSEMYMCLRRQFKLNKDKYFK